MIGKQVKGDYERNIRRSPVPLFKFHLFHVVSRDGRCWISMLFHACSAILSNLKSYLNLQYFIDKQESIDKIQQTCAHISEVTGKI